MTESLDLTKMLEEIIEDEKVGAARNRKVSQEEIKKMLQERQARNQPKDHSKLHIGEALVHEGLITAEQLQDALKTQAKQGGKIGSLLVELGFIADEQLLEFLGSQFGVQSTNLLKIEIPESLMSLLSSRIVLKHRVLPLEIEGRTLSLGMDNPKDFAAVHEVEFVTGMRVNPVIIPSYQMDLALKYITEKGSRVLSGAAIQSILKGPADIESMLDELVKSNGSDLLVTAGMPPTIKVNNTLRRTAVPVVSPDQCVAHAKALMTEGQWEDFLRHKEIDFSIQIEGRGRFRVHGYRQRNTVSLAIRCIPGKNISLKALGLPEWLEDFALKQQGLILISSPTGNGKSTTAAALIDIINRKRQCNIITLEDPVEYVHKSIQSNVNQREIGTDTDSFSEGLKRIFRQAPDVIFIGEIRDPETLRIALTAASTGHLVLSTTLAFNTTSAIEDMVSSFPNYIQNRVRNQIADALLLVFSQRLLPTKSGDRLVPVYEKMINSYRIKNIIRESKVHQMRARIHGDSEDFSSLDVGIINLVKEGRIDTQTALPLMENPELLRNEPAPSAPGRENQEICSIPALTTSMSVLSR
jgi:twitching motility protein PilT